MQVEMDKSRWAMEAKMGKENATTAKGAAAAEGLLKAAKNEERKVEEASGRDLKKGAKRFEERSKSSDGKSAGAKQRG